MSSRLAEKYEIDVEIISKPKGEYLTEEYFPLDLPCAPAIMIGEEVVTEGSDIDDYSVEKEICKQLSLPEPEKEKIGFIDRLFN